MWFSLASKMRVSLTSTQCIRFEYVCLSIDSTWRPVPSRQTTIRKLSSTLFASATTQLGPFRWLEKNQARNQGFMGDHLLVYEAIIGSQSLMESALIIERSSSQFLFDIYFPIWYLLPIHLSDSLKPDIADHGLWNGIFDHTRWYQLWSRLAL